MKKKLGKKLVGLNHPIPGYRSRSLSDVDESPNSATVGLIWPKNFESDDGGTKTMIRHSFSGNGSSAWDPAPAPGLPPRSRHSHVAQTIDHEYSRSGSNASNNSSMSGGMSAQGEGTLHNGHIGDHLKSDGSHLYDQLLIAQRGVRRRRRQAERKEKKEQVEEEEYKEYLRASERKFYETMAILICTALGWTMLVINILQWQKFPFHRHPYLITAVVVVPIGMMVLVITILDAIDQRNNRKLLEESPASPAPSQPLSREDSREFGGSGDSANSSTAADGGRTTSPPAASSSSGRPSPRRPAPIVTAGGEGGPGSAGRRALLAPSTAEEEGPGSGGGGRWGAAPRGEGGWGDGPGGGGAEDDVDPSSPFPLLSARASSASAPSLVGLLGGGGNGGGGEGLGPAGVSSTPRRHQVAASPAEALL